MFSKNLVKKNLVFIVLLLVTIVCFIKKDNYLPINIVDYPDSYVEFTAKDGVLEQTWLSQVKEISAVKVPFIAKNDFEDEMKMAVIDSQSGDIITWASQSVQFIKEEENTILFPFEPVDVETGSQYIFRLEYGNTKKDNTLMIKSGTNYMGCSVGGKEVNQGAAFEITYLKNSTIFWLYISFLPFLGFGFLFMILWEKKWEEIVGLSTAVSIFIMFIGGLFGKLEAGIGGVYILSVAALIAGIVIFNKKDKNVRDLVSPGLLIYGIFVLLILMNCRGIRLARWDEFSHWGLAAKDMFYSDSFAKHFDSTVILKSYPPVATLMEYFFCYTNKLFSYNMVYVGFQLLVLNLLSAALGICKKEKKRYVVPIAMLMLFTPIIFFYDVYNCIYADPLLACGVAYILVCYFTEKMSGYNYLRIVGGLFLLTLIKDTGVVLAGLLTLVMLGDALFQQYKEHKFDLKKSLIMITTTVLVCAFFFVWQFFLSVPMEREILDSIVIEQESSEIGEAETMSVSGAINNSRIDLDGIINLFKGDDAGYRYTVIKNYIKAITGGNEYSFGVISLSYMDILVVIIALLFLLYFRRGFVEGDTRGISFGILTAIAAMAYAGFLLVTYLFSFSMGEAVLLVSHVRYWGSCIGGIIFAMVVLILNCLDEEKRVNSNNAIVIVCAILMIATPFEDFVIKNTVLQLTDEQSYGYDDIAQILYSDAQKTDAVYFVCNGSDGHANLQFANAISPIQSSLWYYNLYSSKESYKEQIKIDEEKMQDTNGTPYYLEVEQWEEQLQSYEYVVIFYPNEVFEEGYRELFREPETIDQGTIYRVNKEGQELVLDYVGKTGIKDFR